MEAYGFLPLNGNSIEKNDLRSRLRHLDQIVVHHKRFNELYEIIKDCHEFMKGAAILGDTGAGKSTLFKVYENRFPKVERVRTVNSHKIGYTATPVLLIELDSNSKPQNVASKILQKLGDPFFNQGTEKQLTARVRQFIIDADVELLIIDELQHLIDTDTQRVIKKAADWLKQLLNDVNLPIIFGGIKKEAIDIFKNNRQLDERFPNKPDFLGFPYKTKENELEFRGFLKIINNQLPFADTKKSKIYDPYLADKIYYSTLGMSRTLNHLLHHSVKYALRAGKDMIEESDLQHGFSLLTFETRPKVINPFDGKVFELKVALEKEKIK